MQNGNFNPNTSIHPDILKQSAPKRIMTQQEYQSYLRHRDQIIGPSINSINISPMLKQQIESEITKMLIQSPIALERPTLIPHIITKIIALPHLVQQFQTNRADFQNTITDPRFLEMIASQVVNQSKTETLDTSNPSVPSNLGNPGISDNPGNPGNSGISCISGVSGISGISIDQEVVPDDQTVVSNTMKISEPNNAFAKQPILINDETSLNSTNSFSPSEQLTDHVLPDMEPPFLIDYSVSLDTRSDLDPTGDSLSEHLSLKFIQYGNLSKIELVSCLIPEHELLNNEPYIYIKISELGGRCYLSNHDLVFGKLLLTERKNGLLYYLPDRGSCIQYFTQPITLKSLTISFCDFQGQVLNLEEIAVQKTINLKKTQKIKFITSIKHNLIKDQKVKLCLIGDSINAELETTVDEIIDPLTFTIQNTFPDLSKIDHIEVYRSSFNCSFQFKFYEINWNVLNKTNEQSRQLIKLSNLLTARRKEIIDSQT